MSGAWALDRRQRDASVRRICEALSKNPSEDLPNEEKNQY